MDRRLCRADHDGALLTLATDAATIEAALRRGLLRIIGQSEEGSAGAIEQSIDALVTIARLRLLSLPC